jgi:GNAT superfamily N-acetyltransferase
MNKQEMMDIALLQSSYDSSCRPEDFVSGKNRVVISKKHEKARSYLKLPAKCDLVSYGSNIVAAVSEELKEEVQRYIDKYPVEHCFETPDIYALNDVLKSRGLKICFMAEYFLPEPGELKELSCDYPIRMLHPEEFSGLYKEEWSNALCSERRQLDVLAVGAYDGEKLIGLAGASADCEMMYQIGIDVLPEYRRKGIASALTSRLALEIFELGKVPFYCAAWSNIRSVKNAVRSGFRPAWVEMTARSGEFIKNML